MVDAGSVKGEFIIDDSDYKKATNNAISSSKKVEKSFGGMAKSLFGAQLAYDAVKNAATALINITKEGIKSAIDYRETQNKFNVVFGNGTKVIKEAIKAQENLTKNYGLSRKASVEMLSATGDLLTGLGFSKESAIELSEKVQTLAVDLTSFQNIEGGATTASEALTKAILGETEMAKSLGIVIRQGTKEFNSQIKVLMETQGLTETQAKAQLILSQAYEQSKNAIGDYARTADSTANMQKTLEMVQQDIITQLGTAFLPVVHEMTKAFLDNAKGLRAWLDNTENFEKLQNIIAHVAAGFEVFIGIVKEIGSTIFQNLKKGIKDIWESFSKLFSGLKGNISVFDILGGALEIINIGIGVGIKFIKTIIQANIDYVNILKEVAGLLVAIGKGMLNPIKNASLVDEALKKTGDAFLNFGKNIKDNTTDIISDVVDGFKKIPKSAQDNSEKYNAIMEAGLEKYKYKFEETKNEILEKEEQTNEELATSEEDLLKEYQELQSKYNNDSLKNNIAHLEEMKQAAIAAGEDEKEVTKTVRSEVQKLYQEGFQKIAQVVSYFIEQISSAYQGITDVVNMFYENDYNMLVSQNEAKLESLQESKEEQLEVIQTDYETQLADLQASYDAGLISEAEYNAQKDILDKQKAEKEAATNKAMDDKIAEQKSENLKKQNAEKKKQFEANKANQIAMAWINFATGAISAYVGAFQALGWMPVVGPALALAMGSVMMALLLGTTIAQTVAISQQQFVPEKALGGSVEAGTTYSVNERGQELFTPGVNGYISPASVTSQITRNVEGQTNNKGMTNIFNFDGAVISDQMSLDSIANYVIDALGRKLELA